MQFGEMMDSCLICAYRCHPKVIVDGNYTKPKLDFNWKRIRINLRVVYLNQKKISTRKNQDKPLRDLN